MLCGHFNRLNISRLASQFKLKQLIDKPTRGDRTLDLVVTNLASMYDKNSVEILPPFGLYDHNVVVLRPKARVRPGLVLAGSLLQDVTHATVKSGNLVVTPTLLTGRYWSQLTARAKLILDLTLLCLLNTPSFM